MSSPRSILRDLVIALGVLALAFVGLFMWITLSGDRPKIVKSYFDPVASDPPMPKVPLNTEHETIPRFVVNEHFVVGGESFSMITGIYWDDIFLWPDLYLLNDMKSGDPDIIFPDEVVKIYNRLGRGDNYTEKERTLILDAYIQVYERFKILGPHKNSSAWTLLWCGAKYSPDFLDRYAHRIDPGDLAVARRYIAEEGYLD